MTYRGKKYNVNGGRFVLICSLVLILLKQCNRLVQFSQDLLKGSELCVKFYHMLIILLFCAGLRINA